MRKPTLLLISLMAVISCNQPYSPSNQEVFLQQKDVCMVVGQKEYIGGAGALTQSSFNTARKFYRGGNVEQFRDTVTNCMVDLVNEYYVLMLNEVPEVEGTTVSGMIYLKHKTLPNSFRTYGSADKPVEFDILRKNDDLAWLWAASLNVGLVIKTSVDNGR